MQESLEASLVRIRTADGRVVGAGFLVGEHHILTCAHVVSQALGLPDSPLEPPQALVSLDFPLVPPRTLLTASVVQWCPPLSDGRGDIAGLELQGDPPTGSEVVRFAPAEDVWKHDFSALGFPKDLDDGVWATGRLLGRQATNWIQIEDVKAQGFAVAPGFSGTPVWDTQLQGVVGMVVAASRPTETRTAFVIPLDVLAAAWPLLTVPPGKPRNPYKGLRPFTQRDAADFFGREAVVEKVVELVNSLVTDQPARSSTRLLTILGPSGAGKSSLVMAGLLPQLQRGMLAGSETWLSLDPIVPGKHPIESLVLTLAAQLPDRSLSSIRADLEDEAARGLHQLCTHLLNIHRREQPGARVILLVDQCEELFTQTESEDERQRFIQLLLTACSEPRGPVVVLLTLRADFYDRPMQYPDLFRLIETQHLSLLSIEPDDLRRVVEQPAALPGVQVTFEGDLVNRLLADVQGQVGALPLLQFTLDQLFQRRNGRQLTLFAYRELGGVKGALTKQAEETYTALPSEEHRKLARALFVRLIDPGATEQDTTRRRAALSEFTLADATQTCLMRETIDAFIAVRLLTTNEIAGTTTIEVSHEALIREWPRLAGWLREARDDIRLQQTISKDATNWEQRNKPADRLYRGSQLKEAQAWARRNTPSDNEVAFLRAGAVRHTRARLSAMAIVLLVSLLLVPLGWQVRQFFLPSVTNLKDDGLGSLRQAIDTASSGGKITFDRSLRGTIVLKSRDLIINKNLSILGPGDGTLAISSVNNHRIEISVGVSVSISGLIFKDGKFTSTIASINSFIVNKGTLMLTNNVISDNTFTDGGCSVHNTGILMLTDSMVSGNKAIGNSDQNIGGCVWNDAGMFTITNSIVSGNLVTVTGSRSKGGGGGIFNTGMLTLTNSVVSGNTVTVLGSNSSGGGGGIWNSGGMLTLTNSTVSDNTVTVTGNSNSSIGGGIWNSGGMLTLTNSTISRNTAGKGAGIAISNSQVNITFCTIYDNTASVGGGVAIIDKGKKSSQVDIRNSIVADNHADMIRDIAGTLNTYGYNLIQVFSGVTFVDPLKLHGTDISGNTFPSLGIDPKLRDNGGSTNPHTHTHALLPGSPAIDAIPLQYCQVKGILNSRSRMYTDQRGMKRPDGNEQFCDIGAYESSP